MCTPHTPFPFYIFYNAYVDNLLFSFCLLFFAEWKWSASIRAVCVRERGKERRKRKGVKKVGILRYSPAPITNAEGHAMRKFYFFKRANILSRGLFIIFIFAAYFFLNGLKSTTPHFLFLPSFFTTSCSTHPCLRHNHHRCRHHQDRFIVLPENDTSAWLWLSVCIFTNFLAPMKRKTTPYIFSEKYVYFFMHEIQSTTPNLTKFTLSLTKKIRGYWWWLLIFYTVCCSVLLSTSSSFSLILSFPLSTLPKIHACEEMTTRMSFAFFFLFI